MKRRKTNTSSLDHDDDSLALAHLHYRLEDGSRGIVTSCRLENIGKRHEHLALIEQVIRIGEKLDGLTGELGLACPRPT